MTEQNQTIISCENLSFAWQREALLKDVSFQVHAGEFVVVIGGNGTGKSTLMRLMLNEMDADQGRLSLFGTAVGEFHDWSRIAYLPQNATDRNLSFPATAMELLRAFLQNRRKKEKRSSAQLREMALEALGQVGLAEEADSMLGELSGGQQQRVLLASVIAARPELMLLDEPTSGIDYENSLLLYHLLRHMKEELGITIFLITHDTDRIAVFADRVFCLEGGSLLELSKEQVEFELKHRHSHPLPRTESLPCCWAGCERKGGADV